MKATGITCSHRCSGTDCGFSLIAFGVIYPRQPGVLFFIKCDSRYGESRSIALNAARAISAPLRWSDQERASAIKCYIPKATPWHRRAFGSSSMVAGWCPSSVRLPETTELHGVTRRASNQKLGTGGREPYHGNSPRDVLLVAQEAWKRFLTHCMFYTWFRTACAFLEAFEHHGVGTRVGADPAPRTREAVNRARRSEPAWPPATKPECSMESMRYAEAPGNTRRKIHCHQAGMCHGIIGIGQNSRKNTRRKTSTSQSWNVSSIQQHKPKPGARPKAGMSFIINKMGATCSAREMHFSAENCAESIRKRHAFGMKAGKMPAPETEMAVGRQRAGFKDTR